VQWERGGIALASCIICPVAAAANQLVLHFASNISALLVFTAAAPMVAQSEDEEEEEEEAEEQRHHSRRRAAEDEPGPSAKRRRSQQAVKQEFGGEIGTLVECAFLGRTQWVLSSYVSTALPQPCHFPAKHGIQLFLTFVLQATAWQAPRGACLRQQQQQQQQQPGEQSVPPSQSLTPSLSWCGRGGKLP
jgi:hypothetical protein